MMHAAGGNNKSWARVHGLGHGLPYGLPMAYPMAYPMAHLFLLILYFPLKNHPWTNSFPAAIFVLCNKSSQLGFLCCLMTGLPVLCKHVPVGGCASSMPHFVKWQILMAVKMVSSQSKLILINFASSFVSLICFSQYDILWVYILFVCGHLLKKISFYQML